MTKPSRSTSHGLQSERSICCWCKLLHARLWQSVVTWRV
jgi:hypothetical protein